MVMEAKSYDPFRPTILQDKLQAGFFDAGPGTLGAKWAMNP
jgi:hypothetical protein